MTRLILLCFSMMVSLTTYGSCGKDFSCMAEKAKSCESAEANYKLKMGPSMTDMRYKIIGKKGERCQVDIYWDSMSSGDANIDAQIQEKMKAAGKSYPLKTSECFYATDKLVEKFTQLSNGSYHAEQPQDCNMVQ